MQFNMLYATVLHHWLEILAFVYKYLLHVLSQLHIAFASPASCNPRVPFYSCQSFSEATPSSCIVQSSVGLGRRPYDQTQEEYGNKDDDNNNAQFSTRFFLKKN